MKTRNFHAMSSEKPGKRTITLEIDALDFEAIDRADVGQILRDALGEFLATRGVHKSSTQGEPCAVKPDEVEPYVERRYEGNAERFKHYKVRNVAKRCTAAMALRRAAVTIYAHDEPLGDLGLESAMAFSREVQAVCPEAPPEMPVAPGAPKRELLVRKLADREIVRRIDVGDRGPRAIEKIMHGLLRNMDTDKFFVDDSACT